jgi:biopolymer transport protein ExbD
VSKTREKSNTNKKEKNEPRVVVINVSKVDDVILENDSSNISDNELEALVAKVKSQRNLRIFGKTGRIAASEKKARNLGSSKESRGKRTTVRFKYK